MTKLYRVIVELEVEAESEDDAYRQAENEVSQSAFEGVHSVRQVED
jgi:hypothetical protein